MNNKNQNKNAATRADKPVEEIPVPSAAPAPDPVATPKVATVEVRDITVRLAGSVGNTVELKDVSAAEVAIIRTAQRSGQAVVFKDDKVRVVERTLKQEAGRLAAKYNRKFLDAAYPGWHNNRGLLPTSFEHIDDSGEAATIEGDGAHTIFGAQPLK